MKYNFGSVELKIAVKRVKKVSKGGVLIEMDSKRDYEVLEMEFKTNDNLNNKVEMKKAEKQELKLIIYNVNEHLKNKKN